jgi:hypothetical protein
MTCTVSHVHGSHAGRSLADVAPELDEADRLSSLPSETPSAQAPAPEKPSADAANAGRVSARGSGEAGPKTDSSPPAPVVPPNARMQATLPIMDGRSMLPRHLGCGGSKARGLAPRPSGDRKYCHLTAASSTPAPPPIPATHVPVTANAPPPEATDMAFDWERERKQPEV